MNVSDTRDCAFEAFITNLGKYNEGFLVGEWVKFPVTNEEMQAVFRRIGIGRRYEEWFITDYDCPDAAIGKVLGEYESLSELNYLAGQIMELRESDDFWQTVLDLGENTGSVQELINLTENLDCFDYLPGVRNDYDLGYYWIEESGCYDTSNLGALANYIDYDGFGRDIRYEEGGVFGDNGYVDGYGENNPIVEKSQFIMSLVEQIDKAGVGPQQKSIIDRCTALVYQDAERTGKPATLCDLRNKLLEQPEEKAKEIALSLELFTTGSLDIFGHESTVDLDKRIVVFDIHGLGEQLKPTGLLVITDTILNRVTLNWKKGKRTHIFIDEFHVVFENEQSGIFFNSAWRQFRKRNGYPTAITQNVEYLLDSVQASTMLSNSEFVVMLNQAFSDRAKLSKLLNISDEQMSYVTNADAGCGLIKYGSALVPFINRFPKDTELYRLMTTRPGEGVFGSGNAS